MDGRKKRSEGTRRQILSGAREVFLEEGFSGASMKDIAVRSGVTQSLIHHHYGNKDGLWQAVQERGFQDVLDDLRPALSTAAKSGRFLEALVESYFKYLSTHPDYVRLLSWTYAERGREVPTNPGQARQAVDLIRSLQEEGKVFSAIDAELVLPLVWSMVEGWFLGRRVFIHRLGIENDRNLPDSQYLEAIKALLREGVLKER